MKKDYKPIKYKAAAVLIAVFIASGLVSCGEASQGNVKVVENPKIAAVTENDAQTGNDKKDPGKSDEKKSEKKQDEKSSEKPGGQEAPAESGDVKQENQTPDPEKKDNKDPNQNEKTEKEDPKDKSADAPAKDQKKPEEKPSENVPANAKDGENASAASIEASRAKSSAAKALVERAYRMQDFSHAEGQDSEPVTEVDDNILLLANKTHPLSRNYKPSDMQVITKITEGVGTDDTHQMRKVAADALYELFDGAEKAGYDLRLRTGFRSYNYQNSLYTNYVKNNGEAAANRFSAKPGESEHQTGLCCDVGVNGVGLTDFNNRPEAKWVADHAHEYGFILRYPQDKEDVTGYMYESWHIRYVGIDAATEIWEQGVCLEEYLGVTD